MPKIKGFTLLTWFLIFAIQDFVIHNSALVSFSATNIGAYRYAKCSLITALTIQKAICCLSDIEI